MLRRRSLQRSPGNPPPLGVSLFLPLSIIVFLLDFDLQFLRSLRSDDAPPSFDSSDSEGFPFPGVPEDTKEYIRQLLREMDEAQQNYSQETIRSEHLNAELEVAQSDRAVVRA